MTASLRFSSKPQDSVGALIMPEPPKKVEDITESPKQEAVNEAKNRVLLRDPFAAPGTPGNRWIQYGGDAPIPAKFRATVDQAIDLAYKLNNKPQFRETFRDTVSKLVGKDLEPLLYLNALDKMVIHWAEGSKNNDIRKNLEDEAKASKQDPSFQFSPAFSIVNGRDIWLREFQLQKGVRAVVGSLIHEAAHLAGAPNNPLAEIALDRIHNAAGYPR
jgi:hypothetical protein